MKSFKYIISILSVFAIGLFINPTNTYAADATVVFGSDSYENENGTEFPVGVYIDGDSEVGYYNVEIEYDPARLEYLGGATSGGDGKIFFEGNGNDTRVSTMLNFRALSGGETRLKISEATIRVSGAGNELFDVTELADVAIVINGEDTVGSRPEVENETETESDRDIEADSDVDNDEEVVAPHSSNSDKGSFPWILIIILVLAGVLGTIIAILTYRGYKRKKKRREYVKAYGKKFSQNAAAFHRKKNKNFNSLESKAATVNKEEVLKKNDNKPEKEENKQEKSETKSEIEVKVTYPQFDTSMLPINEVKRIVSMTKSDSDKEAGEPIIQVKNVSMEFKVSNSNASGLKDYAIQKVRGKLQSRKLKALDNVSFDVYKGEVVGIIGTNGSGKSTLLKIVSGALNPTEGEVIADKNKIQLLTLGTGFDGELSARENVYLNGAIIGYTKEFIDKHYNEIVEFAELQDFMEEKVKNFSSGMVSRLGFSIATVAGAAEILILDEVLAVGDQFFRKKSMSRIKDMIHGGSTVLIVSHSMQSIKAHCTKVIWIEKGKLQMVGIPSKVCEAYAKFHDNKNEKGVKNLKNGEDKFS